MVIEQTEQKVTKCLIKVLKFCFDKKKTTIDNLNVLYTCLYKMAQVNNEWNAINK